MTIIVACSLSRWSHDSDIFTLLFVSRKDLFEQLFTEGFPSAFVLSYQVIFLPMKLEFQHKTSSPAFPFDIISLIIDIVGENDDTDLLNELALVSHSFLQLCTKHIFANIDLHDGNMRHNTKASSKKGFIKLVKNKPDVARYIRKLKYQLDKDDCSNSRQSSPTNSVSVNDDDQLLPTLSNFLATIPSLGSFDIYGNCMDWRSLDSSLTSSFLHLMHLPTIKSIDLNSINNFPGYGLFGANNLHRLDIGQMISDTDLEEDEDGTLGMVLESEVMPKLRELRIAEAYELTMKLVLAKMEDGRPAFKFVDLRLLSVGLAESRDIQIFGYFINNARFLETLQLSITQTQSLLGLHAVLAPRARTLKSIELSVNSLETVVGTVRLPLGGFCRELEAMAGRNILEEVIFEIFLELGDKEEVIGPIVQNVEKALVRPGFPALQRVIIKFSCLERMSNSDEEKLAAMLESSIPEKYLSNLLEHPSVDLYCTADLWTFS